MREDSLIVRAVALIWRPPGGDIGRQRHFAALIDCLIEIGVMIGEGQRYRPAFAFFGDGCIKLTEKAHAPLVAKADDIPRCEALGGFDEGPPVRAVNPFDQRCLDRRFDITPSNAPPLQAGGNDLGVIDHQCIAWTQQIRQIANDPILPFRHVAGPHHQQLGAVARLRGSQRNPLPRKFEIEQIGPQTVLSQRKSRVPDLRYVIRTAGKPGYRAGEAVRSSGFGRHPRRHDTVRIADRFAAFDLVDILHAFGDLTPDRILAVKPR